MRPKVIVTRPLPGDAGERLAERADVVGHDVDAPLPYERLRALVPDAAGVVSVLSDRIDAPLLAAAPALRVVANVAVGYDNVDLAAARRAGVVVTNTPDVLTETTADLTWALLLAAARRVVEADRDLRRGAFRTWELGGWLGWDVHGKTLGVVGFGRIGRAVARRAAGFGMRVLYSDPTPAADEVEALLGAEYVPLARLLAESHFVAVHAPLTPATRHLIDAAALAAMRPDAVLVNVARGPIVDEAALVAALRDRRIAAAGLDVYEDEPALAPGLADLPNTVLLPHVGSATHETRARMARMAVDNVLAVLAGETPPNRVA